MNVPGFKDRDTSRTIQAVLDLAAGGTNAIGQTITLAVGATETEVINRNCGFQTMPVLVPHSAAAASSGWWVKLVERGRFVIGHAPAAEGAVFRYELRQP